SRLTESRAVAKQRARQVVVARRCVAELRQRAVDPRRQLAGWRQLEDLVLDARAEAAAVDVDRKLGARPSVEVPALGVCDGQALDEVIQQLIGRVAFTERRVAEAG